MGRYTWAAIVAAIWLCLDLGAVYLWGKEYVSADFSTLLFALLFSAACMPDRKEKP